MDYLQYSHNFIYYLSIIFVLNLIINGLPSIRESMRHIQRDDAMYRVLNLIINGLPSILIVKNL